MNTNQQHQEQQQAFYQEGYRPAEGYHQPMTGEYQVPHMQYQEHGGQVVYTQPELFPAELPHTDARFVAALTYSVGWLSGLLFALFATERRYIRYHALQSLIFFGIINMVDVGLLISMGIAHRVLWHLSGPFLFLGMLAFLLLNFIAFVGWLVAIVQAYRGKYYRLPIAGTIAANILHVNTALK